MSILIFFHDGAWWVRCSTSDNVAGPFVSEDQAHEFIAQSNPYMDHE